MRQRLFFVYALYNQPSDKIYIGQTKDLNKRLNEHNLHNDHFTGRIPGEWKLIYQESVATRQEAIRRERQLKSQKGREFVKQIIHNSGNPE